MCGCCMKMQYWEMHQQNSWLNITNNFAVFASPPLRPRFVDNIVRLIDMQLEGSGKSNKRSPLISPLCWRRDMATVACRKELSISLRGAPSIARAHCWVVSIRNRWWRGIVGTDAADMERPATPTEGHSFLSGYRSWVNSVELSQLRFAAEGT